MNEPDRAAGDENAYEQRLRVDECSCRKHAWDPDCDVHGRVPDEDALPMIPGDDNGWHVVAEDEDAYELDDPKHPTYHDRMSDIADLEDVA